MFLFRICCIEDHSDIHQMLRHSTAFVRPGRHLLLAVFGAMLLLAQGSAMAKFVIFSAVSGKVLHNGKPVSGAVLERTFVWQEEQATDSVTTAGDGTFSFPKIERGSFLSSLLPSEPLSEQTIMIRHQGKAYKAWYFVKRNYRDNGELEGRPLRMTCRLEAEPKLQGKVFGLCEFD
jgi:hypothetical protein